jgi:hypothetical protein
MNDHSCKAHPCKVACRLLAIATLPLRIGGIQSTKIVIQKHYIELTTLGRGFWEFASVAKLYYHEKLFPLVGTAVGVDKDVQDGINGRFTSMVIYDEAGNGKLELREEMNTGKHPFVFHLPSWSQGNCCTIAISPTAGSVAHRPRF